MATMHSVTIEQFEGPLDLLLQLIEENKLEITTISLATVTEQYLHILKDASEQHIKLHELADFLVVAARLLLIKSRALLPFLHWDEDDETEDLTHQLKMYREYLEASKKIHAKIQERQFSFAREKIVLSEEIKFAPPTTLKADDLAKAFRQLIGGLQVTLNLPTESLTQTINIQEKIKNIQEHVMKEARMRFSEIISTAENKNEVVVSFLALLELMKQRIVIVQQAEPFDDIVIERYSLSQ